MKSEFYLLLAVLCLILCFPALYYGFTLAIAMNSILFFPLPIIVVCVGILYFGYKAEQVM